MQVDRRTFISSLLESKPRQELSFPGKKDKNKGKALLNLS
jgi:hypothetical protein